MAMLEIFSHLEQEMGVDGIILQNDVEPITRAAAQWGNARNIPVMHVPHAHYFDVWRDERGWDVHDVVTAPYVAAINPQQAKWYADRGAKNVRVCGKPQWDTWAKFTLGKERARSLLGLPQDVPVALYMASWPQATSLFGMHGGEKITFIEFCRAVNSIGWYAIVMFHFRASGEINDWHMKTAKEHKIKGIALRDNFHAALMASDVVTAFGPSNALIEASVIDKPTICIGVETPEMVCVPPNAEAISMELTRLRGQGANPKTRALCGPIGQATNNVTAWISEVMLSG